MSSHVPGYADHARAKTLADASLIIIGALVLGVGLVSSGVVRHLVQTAPSWLTVYFGLRRCTEANGAESFKLVATVETITFAPAARAVRHTPVRFAAKFA